jgi:hypothetical protein
MRNQRVSDQPWETRPSPRRGGSRPSVNDNARAMARVVAHCGAVFGDGVDVALNATHKRLRVSREGKLLGVIEWEKAAERSEKEGARVITRTETRTIVHRPPDLADLWRWQRATEREIATDNAVAYQRSIDEMRANARRGTAHRRLE